MEVIIFSTFATIFVWSIKELFDNVCEKQKKKKAPSA